MGLSNVEEGPHASENMLEWAMRAGEASVAPPVEESVVFAGHRQKSLTVHVSSSGLAELVVTVGDVVTRITLTPDEKGRLTQALYSPGSRPVEVTTY